MRVGTTTARADRVQNWSQKPADSSLTRQTLPNSHDQVVPILADQNRATSPVQVNVEEIYRRGDLPKPLELPQASARPSVKAVIGETVGDMVVVICQASGGEYRTRFPKSLIPTELIAFGQSVYLEIDFESVYRTPRFIKRNPDPVVISAELDELNEWMDGL